MKYETEFKLFAEWLDLSQVERSSRSMPITREAFSKEYGLNLKTLSNWKKKILDQREQASGNEFAEFMGRLKDMMFDGKGTAVDRRTFAQINGWLIEKREETHKFELTPDDRIKIAIQFLDGLRREYQDTRVCQVCGQPELLRNEIRCNPESKFSEDREMAALALPARPE